MLVLTRKEGESILIGKPGPLQVKITVVYLDRGKVKVGVEADPSIPVYRDEVWAAMNAEGGTDAAQ